jgi:hypothetical protein
MEEFKVGDKVRVDSDKWPGTWTVAKVNRVSYGLEQNGRQLKAAKEFVLPVTGEAGGGTAQAQPAPETYRYYSPGEFVRPKVGRMAGKILVVLADKGDKVNAADLGGDEGRYWRIVRRNLEPVTLADLAEYLVAGL